jgi:hypothetical protein
MAEALNLYLDEPASSKVIVPLPSKAPRGKALVAIAVDPKIAFAASWPSNGEGHAAAAIGS